ncbi:hypothetical protein EII22_06760 [Coriobacteriales bacterium OH1046]|nr:hypothetical protein EII22_06760 [Coriobacteriales bacterium OH1046]
MPTIIPIRFAYASRDLWFDPVETGAVEGDHVICSTERGTEIGLVTGEAREVSDKEFSSMTDGASLKQLMRVASDEDLARAEELARKGDEAMPVFRRCISGCGLDMKPVGVEYLFDGGKVVCYFAAEDRVDFRQLVRELSHELHARVDMRQIGVREESAHIGGYGHCGQELCCARFGPVFEPVSIRMAKEQDLPLNSAKISGACGRLMCCLRYEFEAYRDFKSRAPKRNAIIETPLGMGKIIEYDTPKEQIALRLENGKIIRVALADMTASETAVRKSEELGCACRPDTVAREVLERLNSPDVQMALAELDRKMGVLEEEPFDSSDIFIEPKPRRRARSAGYTVTESDGEAATSGKDAAQPASRRRRKKAATAEAADREPEKDANDLAATGRRRRRHKSPEGISEASAAPGRTAGESPAAAAPAAKRSRKPGDKGGSPRRAAAPAPEAGGSDDAPSAKKRPRRRGGRGRGGKGDQGGSGEQASE